MNNLEWLDKVRIADGDVDEAIKKAKMGLLIDEKAIGKVILEYRKIKALEIIAEELIGIDDKLGSLINNGKVINVDTHEV